MAFDEAGTSAVSSSDSASASASADASAKSTEARAMMQIVRLMQAYGIGREDATGTSTVSVSA